MGEHSSVRIEYIPTYGLLMVWILSTKNSYNSNLPALNHNRNTVPVVGLSSTLQHTCGPHISHLSLGTCTS